MKKLLIMTGAVAVAAVAVAGSAGADGTDFVVSAESGETYTYSTAVGNYTRLVKRGAGEVELTVSSSGFDGSVVVESGTLTIKHKNAVGGNSVPIEVQSGATLYLKLANDTTFGHTITIAGTGVGDAGAFRTSGTSDNLITHLYLSDDATIDVSGRWGLKYNTYNLDPNGHTLTRIGGGNWMVYNHIKSTGAPGTIINNAGTLTFQGNPIVDSNVTIDVKGGFVGLWGVTGTGISGTIKLPWGGYIQAQSNGSGTYTNHVGAVQLYGASTHVATLLTEYNGNVRSMSVDGALTGDSGMQLVLKGRGNLWLNGDVEVSGNTTIQDNGGPGGIFHLCGDESVRDMRFTLKGGTTTSIEGGRTYLRMLRVANGGAVAAQLRQTGGVTGLIPSDNGTIGETDGSRGYFTLEGGEMHFSNEVYVAKWAGSYGAIRQTGGLLEMRRGSGSNDKFFCAGRGGTALFVQTGGTNDTLVADNTQVSGFQMATNGMCEATISGAGTLFRTGRLAIGVDGGVYTNILNISDGAVVKANRLRKVPAAAGASKAYVNVDGGTLMPTFAWGWTVNANSYPDHFVVWENGITVDTSENATGGGAGGSTFSFALEKPTGRGVEDIALPNLTGKTYIGIARVVIEDATGWGASAYAEYDFDTKTLSRIVITSRGCNYSDNAKAYLESPDRKDRYECSLTLSDNSGRCGMFVKRGVPDLEITSAANTIDGGYAVEGGSLKLGTVPNVAVPVRVASGATLNLNNKGALTASAFEGAGSVINGDVTVTGAIKMTCADIFAGRAATFGGNLTIADGAVFAITDAENLESYNDASRAVVLTSGGAIARVPSVTFTNSDGTPAAISSSWSLRLSADGKSLKFGRDKGMVISVK